MNVGQLTDLITAVTALLAAVYGIYHSIQTRKQVNNPPATVNAPNGGSKTG